MRRKAGDKMSDGTSVGKIYLDLEISKSSISKELQGLTKTLNSSLSSTISGMNSFIKNAFSKFGSSGKSVNEQVAKSATAVNAKYEKTKEKIAQVNSELAKLYAQQDAIAKNYEGMPSFQGMTKDESMQQMLGRDEGYSKLSSDIDKFEAKLSGLNADLGQMESKNEQLNESFNKTSNSTKKAGRSIKLFGDHSKNTEKKVGGLAAVINRSLMTVLRRVFIYSVILKAVRGLINYLSSALKTNKQFAGSLNAIQTNLRVAFQPIYDFILPALNALMRAVAKVSTYIASAISSLFGKSYQQSFNAAKGLETSKKAMDGYGKSTKEASSLLAGFDELNVLQSKDTEDSGAGGFEMTMPDVSTVDLTGFESFMKKIKTMLQPTMGSLKGLGGALKPLKNFASDSLKDFYNNFLVPVGNWTFGEGLPRFIDAITKGLSLVNWDLINLGLNNFWSALSPFAVTVGEGLLWFWENVLVPFGTWTTNEIVPRFLDILAEAIKILNTVIEVLKPLGIWLWDNFLKPLASWTGGAIADILDGIAYAFGHIADYIGGIQDVIANSGSFLDALVNVGVYLVEGLYKGIISAISGIGSWLWDNLVKPIIDWVKKLFGISSPSTVFAEIGVWLIEGLYLGVSNTWYKITVFFTAVLESLKVFFQDAWVSISVITANAWDSIKSTWNGAGEWFSTTVVEPVKKFFADLWGVIKTKASEAWDGVKNIWLTVSAWFNDTVITPVSNFFTNLRDNIKTALSTAWTWVKDIWNGAVTWFKSIGESMFNGMWDGLKSVWENIKSWINGTVEWLKDKLSFWKKSEETMSSTGGEVSGMGSAYSKNKEAEIAANKDEISAISKTKGVDMSTAWSMWKASSIPKLARGGIVEQPTLAMVGERGKEAVMPLERNTGWISELAGQIADVISNIGDSEEINITMPVYLDNEKIYEGQKKVQRRRGKSLVKGALV